MRCAECVFAIVDGRDEDIKVMVGLRDQTEKYKDQIKQLQRDLAEKTSELEHVCAIVCL